MSFFIVVFLPSEGHASSEYLSMMSDDESIYTGEESSAYSYQDFGAYQFSDFEDEGESATRRPPSPSTDDWNEVEEYENAIEWSDNDSLVMYSQCDEKEFELYQFSDEDILLEEPDEEWIVAALRRNREDFTHLELLLEEVEDLPRLIEAMLLNRVVKNVTIYEAFMEGLPTNEEKETLAEAVCNMASLEQLKVYYHSGFFVEPLQRICPVNISRLCLMFFPDKVDDKTLSFLTKIVQNEDDNADANGRPRVALESLSLRCQMMDDRFLVAMANAMAENVTLTTLSFWGKNVDVSDTGSRASAKIDFYLKLNQSKIRNLHLLVNASPNHFLEKIITERDNIDHLFYLLLTNPSFLSYSIYL